MDLLVIGMIASAEHSNYSVLITFSDGATLTVEGRFFYADVAGARQDIDPDEQTDQQPALAPLVGRTVLSCCIDDASGELKMEFVDGGQLTLPPDPSYEAWQIRTSENTLIVCGPGGNLTVWSSPSVSARASNP